MNKSERYKVVFFGTSDKTTPILESLNRDFDLLLCVTKTDTKIGRNQETRETAVKSWAKKHQIKYLEIPNLKSPSLEEVIEHINDANPDLVLVCDFNMIIPQKVLDALPGKFINIHFSMLPKYRGAAPVQFSILKGEKTTGISFQVMTYEMDKGDILEQIEYEIPDNITSGQLMTKLFSITAENVTQVLSNFLKGALKAVPQNEDQATYTYSLTNPKSTLISKEDARINWQESPTKIYNSIRAFNPWPIAWTTLEELQNNPLVGTEDMYLKNTKTSPLKVKIYKAQLENEQLLPIDIQIEGKNRTDWNSFLNGYLSEIN